MPLTITLVRHGNTDANVERWLQGQSGNNRRLNGKKQELRD